MVTLTIFGGAAEQGAQRLGKRRSTRYLIEIPLSRGQVAIIDDNDLTLVDQYKWCARPHGKTYYAITHVYENGKQKSIQMHHLIFGRGADHKDRNGLNNQRNNLRAATQEQNLANRGIQKNNTSGYKGVSFYSRTNRWRAAIRAGGRFIHIGTFLTREQAAIAYNDAAMKYHGEFAVLNEIDLGGATVERAQS